MLDIIKALVEIAAKLVGAADRLRGERFKDVGRKLLVLYFRVNETIEEAQEIILAMQAYRRDMDEWVTKLGQPEAQRYSPLYSPEITRSNLPRSNLNRLESALKIQALNLGRLAGALSDVRLELSLVDRRLARRLDILVMAKSDAVSFLRLALMRSEIPIWRISPEELDTASERDDGQWWPLHGWNLAEYGDGIIELPSRQLGGARIGSKRPYQQIAEYLDSGYSQSEVAELENLADTMREQIGKHWSLGETLPHATRLIRKADEEDQEWRAKL
jgi:hypothetical protein